MQLSSVHGFRSSQSRSEAHSTRHSPSKHRREQHAASSVQFSPSRLHLGVAHSPSLHWRPSQQPGPSGSGSSPSPAQRISWHTPLSHRVNSPQHSLEDSHAPPSATQSGETSTDASDTSGAATSVGGAGHGSSAGRRCSRSCPGWPKHAPEQTKHTAIHIHTKCGPTRFTFSHIAGSDRRITTQAMTRRGKQTRWCVRALGVAHSQTEKRPRVDFVYSAPKKRSSAARSSAESARKASAALCPSLKWSSIASSIVAAKPLCM